MMSIKRRIHTQIDSRTFSVFKNEIERESEKMECIVDFDSFRLPPQHRIDSMTVIIHLINRGNCGFELHKKQIDSSKYHIDAVCNAIIKSNQLIFL